jgi:hypothetical protein
LEQFQLRIGFKAIWVEELVGEGVAGVPGVSHTATTVAFGVMLKLTDSADIKRTITIEIINGFIILPS